MERHETEQLRALFAERDAEGVSNAEKIGAASPEECPGVVLDAAGRFIGFGIHILNESVYPIEKFTLYLRDKGLCGHLDLSNCRELVFTDVYRNRISSVNVAGETAMRILGLQDNCISELDVTTLSACQGIDVGKNRLRALDVSQNAELVELYIHGNEFTEMDIRHNPKLKYFWCNGNRIARLDTRVNPLLRHLDCRDNPLTYLIACAPGSDGREEIELTALEGGYIGMKFCPVYTPQWKETGEWQQTYFAYPLAGYSFAGWYDGKGACVSTLSEWVVEYGQAAKLAARFVKA